MQSTQKKRLVIIGAGPSGLAATKEALFCGLEPTVFEKSGKVGGVWNNDRGQVWPSMRANVSKYHFMYSDYPWKESADLIPHNTEAYEYFQSYADIHGLEKYINFNCEVVSAQMTKGESWEVTWKEGGINHTDIFDFMIIAIGLCSKPQLPKIPGIETFKGNLIHSSQYNEALDLKEKKILILGAGNSANEIASNLAASSHDVTQIIRNPFFIVPKVHTVKDVKIPSMMALRTRNLTDQDKEKTDDEMKKNLIGYLRKHTRQDETPELQRSNDDVVKVSKSDNYVEDVLCGKIKIKRTTVKKIQNEEIILDDGSVLKPDILIFCTGYFVNFDFFDEKVKKIIDFDENDDFLPFPLLKSTFHPDIPTVAFLIGCKFDIHPMELQARWATLVFSNKIQPPSRDQMIQGVLAERVIKKTRKFQFPYFDSWDFSELIAEEIGALPNLEEIKNRDPELFEAIWKGPYLAAHYRLNGIGSNYEIAVKTIKEVWNKFKDVFVDE
jgi:dimethylaniline monooxygenase (N-oxide forming)